MKPGDAMIGPGELLKSFSYKLGVLGVIEFSTIEIDL